MVRAHSIALLLMLSACGGASEPIVPENAPPAVPWPGGVPFASALDAVVPDRLARNRIPGAVVALVTNGALDVVEGYGEAVRETRVPVTEATVFQVASISKSVAAWGVLRLVEAGRLEIDEPVGARLARWHWHRRPSTTRRSPRDGC
jgi:CubicO group peptidase (beta-lactamase class C family)